MSEVVWESHAEGSSGQGCLRQGNEAQSLSSERLASSTYLVFNARQQCFPCLFFSFFTLFEVQQLIFSQWVLQQWSRAMSKGCVGIHKRYATIAVSV